VIISERKAFAKDTLKAHENVAVSMAMVLFPLNVPNRKDSVHPIQEGNDASPDRL
jgi:hypothetical protein